VKRILEDQLKETTEKVLGGATDRVNEVQAAIEGRLRDIVQTVTATSAQSRNRFAGVNEEEILKFIPDKRNFSGVANVLLGLLVLVLLPGMLKIVSVLFFVLAAFNFLVGYINNSKIDVPDGFEGVICRYGIPLSGEEGKSKKGRNWQLRFSDFIPFLVSKRDLLVEMTTANFTGDYASIAMSKQFVMRVVTPQQFISTTSPAAMMKILAAYASYISLRMITSITDARVKFTGRDRLENVVQALNANIAERYGARVERATMPQADNQILNDLEQIRTQLKNVEVMNETKQVKLESAIKAVESEMRSNIKESRGKAVALQQAQITLETRVSEQVNANRQDILISTRVQLEQAISELRQELATFKAKLQKAQSIAGSLDGLKTGFEIRKSALKRRIWERLVPPEVSVFAIEGIGPGLGMSLGNDILNRLIGTKTTVSREDREPEDSSS
jgi:hypothetical protein